MRVRAMVLWTLLAAAWPAVGPAAPGEAPVSSRPDPLSVGLVTSCARPGQGLTLIEVSRTGCPALLTLSPRLARFARQSPARIHRLVEFESWEGPVARRLGLRAVPSFYLYRGGHLVARGTQAMRLFLAPTRPPASRPRTSLELAGRSGSLGGAG